MKRLKNAAMVLLVNKDGYVLMQHRTYDAPSYPGTWAFFGGALEGDEEPELGAKRELLEELSYVLDNPKVELTVEYDNDKGYGTKYYFIVPYDEKQKFELKEGLGYTWIPLSDLSNFNIAEHNLKVLDTLKQKIEQLKK